MASTVPCDTADCLRAFLDPRPSLTANVVFLALFAVLIPVALVLGVKYKSLAFAIPIATGLVLEVLGYIGRLLLHNEPNSRAGSSMFLVGTTLGPTCIWAAVLLIAPRVVAVYGEEYYGWRPVWYLIFLSILTTASLILEFTGSVVLTVQDVPTVVDTGIQILLVGLAVLLVALVIFIVHAVFFVIALRKRQHGLDPKYSHIYTSNLFRASVSASSVATSSILFRTAYQIMHLAEPLQSFPIPAELSFLLLDAAGMLIATILLLAFIPARVFGQSWPETSFRRLARQARRMARPEPARLLISRPGPVHDQMNMKSTSRTDSPGRTNYAAPIPQREMVDSENLW
ncbi:RTA1 like protein-domain-containing protein [Xylaria cf. heliscus]|nr:RTA1 like protein-domain-containing protein [Xylaria cf. heliscus]